MQRVTSCSCLNQVMQSLLLESSCSEHVGGVWHKQGFQLAEPGTDGAGKWGTSQKHWNAIQRPSPHFSLSLSSTLPVIPPSPSFLYNSTFFSHDYWRICDISQSTLKREKKPNIERDSNGGTMGLLRVSSWWGVFVHLVGASRWQTWIWTSPGR